jgi:hypothetical protein
MDADEENRTGMDGMERFNRGWTRMGYGSGGVRGYVVPALAGLDMVGAGVSGEMGIASSSSA